MKAFCSYHPFVLIVYFLAVLLFVMFVTNPIFQILALLGGFSFCLLLQRDKQNIGGVWFYIAVFVTVALTNPLFSHNGVTTLFFLNGNPITLESFVYGIILAVTVLGTILWCKCMSLVMGTEKFLYLFGKIIPKLSLILSMSLRFIPMFIRRTKKVSRAQKALGAYSSDDYTHKLKSRINVFSAMVAWALENSIETSLSMKSRGYGIKGRTDFSLYIFHKKDALMLSICAILCTVILIGAASGATAFNCYPQIVISNPSVLSVFAYIAFGILSFLPFIIEIKEILMWKYCVSRI